MASKQSALALAIVGIAACSGTDTGNPPVIDFHSSGCKSKQSSGLVLQSLTDPQTSSDARYDGLTCFVWERLDEHTLRVDLTNYESGCGSENGWKPRSELTDDGALALILQDSDCATAACGWCIYDLSFTVELDEPLLDREVRLYQRGCGDELRGGKKARLPLGSQASGAVCTYAHYHALAWGAGETDSPRALCGPTQGDGPNRECSDGLTCTELPRSAPTDHTGGPRCLLNCQADADCDALSRCAGGVCVLAATGVTAF